MKILIEPLVSGQGSLTSGQEILTSGQENKILQVDSENRRYKIIVTSGKENTDQ